MVEKILKPAFVLDIVLELVDDSATRTIIVPAHYSFYHLHLAIQAAYNWDNSHLFYFLLYINKRQRKDAGIYIIEDYDGNFDDSLSPYNSYLIDFLDKYKFIKYKYDFGDGWLHTIKVVRYLKDCDEPLPKLVKGEHAAPLEDCGGRWGFARLLEAVNDPNDPEHDYYYNGWLGGGGLPAFDFDEVAERVYRSAGDLVHYTEEENDDEIDNEADDDDKTS